MISLKLQHAYEALRQAAIKVLMPCTPERHQQYLNVLGDLLVELDRVRDLPEPTHCWFSYDPGDQFNTHKTAIEAETEAQHAVDAYRDDCGSAGGWAEEVERVCWGCIIEHVREVNREVDPENSERELVDYALRVPE